MALSGPLSFSDSRILPFGLSPYTFKLRPRRAVFYPPRTRYHRRFPLEGSTTPVPGWQAGWGTGFGTLKVSRCKLTIHEFQVPLPPNSGRVFGILPAFITEAPAWFWLNLFGGVTNPYSRLMLAALPWTRAHFILIGPLSLLASRIVPFGLGPETIAIRPRTAGF